MTVDQWLTELKEGDDVISYVGCCSEPYLWKVDRTTAAQIIIGPHRFHRKNGAHVGRGMYSRSHITQPTPELVERATRAAALSKLRRIVDSTAKDIPTAAIVAAVELLQAKENPQ